VKKEVSTPPNPPSNDDKTFKVGEVEFVMKKIPKAENVTLGDNNQDCVGSGICNKAHTVSLTEFYIAETETTQELWKAITGQNPSMWKMAAEGEVAIKQPVERVTWHQCLAFCNDLTKQVLKDEKEHNMHIEIHPAITQYSPLVYKFKVKRSGLKPIVPEVRFYINNESHKAGEKVQIDSEIVLLSIQTYQDNLKDVEIGVEDGSFIK